jgi:hypothetical protein
VSINADVGSTILVSGQGDPNPHNAFAETLAGDIWASRLTIASDRARATRSSERSTAKLASNESAGCLRQTMLVDGSTRKRRFAGHTC